jgi:hypothetical protein
VSANGRRSPAETVAEPTLVKSLPSSSMLLSIRTAFGPDHGEPRAVLPSQPGDGRAVFEAQHELGRDLHLTAQALDDPSQDGVVTTGRHEVDETNGALLGLEGGLQDERLRQVAARHARRLGRRFDQPAPVLGPAEQGVEAGGRVEAG